jgi:ATPase subunit of ABC transporter with duplicated ATPase domains
VTRFRAGTRARQAQSRAKKLAKIDRMQRGPTDGAALSFAFKPPERSGRVVFELEDGSCSICGSSAAKHAARAQRRRPSCGSSAASTSRWCGPNGWPARRR